MQLNVEKTIDRGVKKSIFEGVLLKFFLYSVFGFLFLYLHYFDFSFLSDSFLIFVVLFVYFFYESFLFYYFAELKKFFYIFKDDSVEAFFRKKDGTTIKNEIFYKDVRFCKIENFDRKYSTLFISSEEKMDRFFSRSFHGKDGKVVSLKGQVYPYFGFGKKRIVIPFVPKNEAEEIRNYILLKGGQDLNIDQKNTNSVLYKKMF